MLKDVAQEFAERVSEKFWRESPEYIRDSLDVDRLIELIASELRSVGWQSGFDPNPDNKLLEWAKHNLPVLTGLATRKP